LWHDALDQRVGEGVDCEGFGMADTARVVEAAEAIRAEPCVFDDDGSRMSVCDSFDAARLVTNQFPRITPIRQALFGMECAKREELIIHDDGVRGAEEARV
jgi:hypothetical protein